MKRSPEKSDVISHEAAQWVLRHDRGLTATEQDEFSAWLAADARCREAWAEHRWGWDELDRLAGLQESMHAVPDPDLLARPRRRRWTSMYRLTGLPWATAAVLALALALLFAFKAAEAPDLQATQHQLALIE